MEELIIQMGLRGGERAVSTFLTKLGTGLASSLLSMGINSYWDRMDIEKGQTPSQLRRIIVSSIIAAAGAVGYGVIDENMLSKVVDDQFVTELLSGINSNPEFFY